MHSVDSPILNLQRATLNIGIVTKICRTRFREGNSGASWCVNCENLIRKKKRVGLEEEKGARRKTYVIEYVYVILYIRLLNWGLTRLLIIILHDTTVYLLSNLKGVLKAIQPNVLYKMQVIDMRTGHYNSWNTMFSIVLLNKPPPSPHPPLHWGNKKHMLIEACSRFYPLPKPIEISSSSILGRTEQSWRVVSWWWKLNFLVFMESSIESRNGRCAVR